MSALTLILFWLTGSIAAYVMIKKEFRWFLPGINDDDDGGILLFIVCGPWGILLVFGGRLIIFIVITIKKAIDWVFKIGEYEDRGNSYRF